MVALEPIQEEIEFTCIGQRKCLYSRAFLFNPPHPSCKGYCVFSYFYNNFYNLKLYEHLTH